MKKLSFLLVSGFLLLSLAACGASESKESDSSKEPTKVKTEKTEKAKNDKGTYSNQTLDTKDGTLKITGFERGTDYDGAPMFYVFFDLTNKKETAENVQLLYMDFVTVEQNTGDSTEKLQMAMLIDSPHQDKLDMLQKDVNPGATVQAAYTYKFADETKPVKFTFTDSLISFGDPIGTEEFIIE